MPKQSNEGKHAGPGGGRVHPEDLFAYTKDIASFVIARFVDWAFQPHYDAVQVEFELVGSDPPAVGAQDHVVRRADQCSSVLENELNAFTHAILHQVCLPSYPESAVLVWAKHPGVA